jgi:hypothetical protein
MVKRVTRIFRSVSRMLTYKAPHCGASSTVMRNLGAAGSQALLQFEVRTFASSFTSMAAIFVCYRYKPVVNVIVILQRDKIIFRCISLHVHCIEKCLNEKSYILMKYMYYVMNWCLCKSFRRKWLKFYINFVCKLGHLMIQSRNRCAPQFSVFSLQYKISHKFVL